MSNSKLKDMFTYSSNRKERRYLQQVPEVKKAPLPAPVVVEAERPTVASIAMTKPAAVVPRLVPGESMFPAETVLYKESFRDMVIAPLYNSSLIRPPPTFYIAVGFTSVRVSSKNSTTDENAVIPLVLHRGYDKTYPILGYVGAIETHTTGTILNTAYDPDALFNTTKVDIGAHLTQEYAEFRISKPSEENPAVKFEQVFRWKQCTSHPAVLSLCADRPLPSHDWCMLDRKNERGMCLFRLDAAALEAENAAAAENKKGFFGKKKKVKMEDGEVLAVFVSAKLHSKMNPVKIAARIRWLENEIWTEELKLAAFLAVLTHGEKSRRVGTGGGI